jgi:flagellar motor switch protein FliG
MNTIELIQSFEIEQLFNKIWCEKPEIIAQILVCLQVNKAAVLFQKLHINTQISVIEIISKMEEINPNQLSYINTLLAEQNIISSNENYLAKGGIDCVVEILCLTHKDIFQKIIEKIEKINSSLADEIIKMMSVFEDIVMLSDNEVQIALRNVDDVDLGKALKSVDSEIIKWIFNKLSKERVFSIKKIMDEMGPVNIKDVKDTQWKIVKYIRTLRKEGKL